MNLPFRSTATRLMKYSEQERRPLKRLDMDGNLVDTTITNERRTDEVKQILVKEKWFFDKNHSVMNVRIVGLCPIAFITTARRPGHAHRNHTEKENVWVYFPELRPLFARHEMFNENNDAQRISFDDYFIQRRFNSYIFAESNVYQNRVITDYSMGLDALLEAERIKNYLFETEHDLWEY